ncbi:MAG: tetratricopeptide repeat protein [Planctomycetaceae bacterium]
MLCTTRRNRPARVFLAALLCGLLPIHEALARGGGFGGGGGGFRGGGGGGFGGGGGGYRGGGGGFGGGGGNRGGGEFGGGRGEFGGGGGRPEFGGGGRPEIGGGGRQEFGGGNRPEVGGGDRSPFGGEGRGEFGGGNRPGAETRPDAGNRPAGNRPGENRNININNINTGNINAGNRAAWGNRPGYYHNYNNYWHHGYWHGNWGSPWWYAHPWAAGLTAWGIGSLVYATGYALFANPFYGGYATPAMAGTYQDYSQPIMVQSDQQADPYAAGATDDASQVPPDVQAGLVPFDAAREAFKTGDYALALTKVNEALQKLPKDAALHEFRALVLFAQGQYQQAAATVYSVLAVGPGWDWTTLSSMYPSVDVYTKQLRALEAYRKQNPNAADAAFLLAYHYLTAGHTEAAARQLQAAQQLLPNDTLIPQLLKLITGSAPAGDSSADQPPAIQPGTKPDDALGGPPVDKKLLAGDWKASRGSDLTIGLSLKPDESFVWKVTQGGKSSSIEGKYSVEGNLLLLQQQNGNTMVGKVTQRDKGFNFRLIESGPTDEGLNFTK